MDWVKDLVMEEFREIWMSELDDWEYYDPGKVKNHWSKETDTK